MNNNPIQKKVILVTGAAGFIGERVMTKLVGTGASVIAIDRVQRPSRFPEEAEYQCVDLSCAPNALPPASILVHLAWNMNRNDSAGQKQAAADFAQHLNAGSWEGVVGLGSAEEYGEIEGCLTEEMAPGTTLSFYGHAKHEACRALRAWANSAPGRKAIWLRPFVVYGPEQSGNMAIPYALRCAKEQAPAEFSEGLQFRDFVHVDDVAAGIVAAVQALPQMKTTFVACNLGRGEPVRLRDVLERMATQTQSQHLFHFGARPMRAGEPREQFANTCASSSQLDFRAKIPWQEGVDALCKPNGAPHA